MSAQFSVGVQGPVPKGTNTPCKAARKIVTPFRDYMQIITHMYLNDYKKKYFQ